MSQAKDTVITLQALDGQLEVAGVDRGPGIWPENVETSYNLWLCDQASFDLHRDPKVIWPDLRGGGLVEIEEGGKRVWKGRIKQTPSRDVDRVMSVQCEGMQYHLDDDLVERVYVHSKVSDYRDMRSFLGADLTKFSQSGKVSSDRGVATIGWAKNDAVVANNTAGIMIDLGPGQTVKRVVIDWERVGGQADTELVVRGTNGDEVYLADYLGAGNDPIRFALNGATSGINAGTFATASRYVSIFTYYSSAGGNFAADITVKIKAVRLFADTAYESSFQSDLKASTIVTDALDRGTVLLSSDRSQIQVPTFSIPDFAPDRPRTPRELIEAGNAWQDWLTQIDVYDRPIFKPKPTAPRLEVGAWSPMEPDDSSQNSLEDIYNGVIVAATATDGSQLRVERYTGELAGVPLIGADPAPTNPSADVNVIGWTASAGTVARDTVSFHTTPGSIKWTNTPIVSGQYLEGSFAAGQTFEAGQHYVLDWQMRSTTSSMDVALEFGVPGGDSVVSRQGTTIPFFPFRLIWRPTVDTPSANVKLRLTSREPSAVFTQLNVDSLQVFRAVPTLIDRRGFRRRKTLEVGFTLPTDGVAAQQLADIWLDAHKLTPFKGQVKLTGPTAVRDMLTGLDVPLEHLGLYTGQLLAFNDRSDPDTAGHGRDARMVAYKYNKDRDEGIVTLDNTKSDFEALLARLAVVTGQGA